MFGRFFFLEMICLVCSPSLLIALIGFEGQGVMPDNSFYRWIVDVNKRNGVEGDIVDVT